MKEHDLRVLVANRAPLDIVVAADQDGFRVLVNGQPLASARQPVRPFASLDTVAKVLRGAGVQAFTVQATGDSHPGDNR